jgi:hypothetical protein
MSPAAYADFLVSEMMALRAARSRPMTAAILV